MYYKKTRGCAYPNAGGARNKKWHTDATRGVIFSTLLWSKQTLSVDILHVKLLVCRKET